MAFVDFLDMLRKHVGIILIVPIACAIIVGLYAYLAVPNTYTAVTSMYVLVQQDSIAITSGENGTNLQSDLSASQMVSNDVANLLESNRIQKQTAADLGFTDLSDFDIRVSSETDSRVITVSVTGEVPVDVTNVANTMAREVSQVAQEVMNVQSVNVVDEADMPVSPSGPNRPLYVAVAALVGFLAAVAIVDISNLLNKRVRSESELEELLGMPVVGRIPVSREARLLE